MSKARQLLVVFLCMAMLAYGHAKALFAEETILASHSKHHHGLHSIGHAPISVMRDHVHKKGEWMLSYRYAFMRMSGSRDGHHRIDNQQVLNQYMVVPTEMQAQMHILGFMYAPSDRMALTAMFPFVEKDMNHRNRAGRTFKTHAEGPGDLKISALIPVWEQGGHRIHIMGGVSIPTGEINKEDDLPTGNGQRLPYPMQLGSGTWDLLPGITYAGQSDHWSWGAQSNFVLRPGRNEVGYALGNEYEMTFWGARHWNDWLSQSLGMRYRIWENISGRDPGLNSGMVPTADPNQRGGKRIDLLFGINFYIPKGWFKGHRASIDFGIPIMQSLDGPQLETDWFFTAGWQAAFD